MHSHSIHESAQGAYFKRKDQLGETVNLHYRGRKQSGTILGGLVSCATTISFSLFIFMQTYAWLFEPSFE